MMGFWLGIKIKGKVYFHPPIVTKVRFQPTTTKPDTKDHPKLSKLGTIGPLGGFRRWFSIFQKITKDNLMQKFITNLFKIGKI